MVNFFIGVLVSKFKIKKPVLDIFFPPSIYRLILVGVSKDNSRADGRFRRISLISFFRDSINL